MSGLDIFADFFYKGGVRPWAFEIRLEVLFLLSNSRENSKNHCTSGNPRETTPMNIPQILAEKLIILRLSHSPGHPTPMAGERDARPTFGGEVGLRMESTNGRIKIMVGI